jgi:GT2 family glycosyltransferase/glycosyltransferase involved in cell wall biosynthesis
MHPRRAADDQMVRDGEHSAFHQNISIIVLNYNQAQTTVECIEALHRASSELIREIVVVDNGSDDDEVAILRRHRRSRQFTLVEVGDNRYFSEGNNIGVDHTSTDYIVLLNNDAFVHPGWIETLAGTMEKDPSIAAVGPMFLYPDGRVQEVGGVALATGDVVQIGKGSVWGPEHFDTVCAVDFCSAACLMMRRADYLQVGGLGFEWEPAYYEDTDLCLKLWTSCGKVVVNPLARVTHIESHTTSDRRLQLQNISEINRARFVSKWGSWLAQRQVAGTFVTRGVPAPDHEATLARLPAPVSSRTRPARPRYVLFSPYPLVPGGGERVMFELADFLSSGAGVENVIFSTPHSYSSIRMAQISSTFGFTNSVATPQPLAEIDRPDCQFAVILGNSIVPPIEPFGLRCAYVLQFPFSMPDEEIAEHGHRLSQVSEIWVYSEFVRRHVNGVIRLYGLPAPPIRILPPPAQWAGAEPGSPWPERTRILTVGRFFAGGHNKRQDAVIEAFRRLNERTPSSLELALAGSIHPTAEGRERFRDLQDMADGLNSSFHPNISRDDLARLYMSSGILIHAAGMGVDELEFPEQMEHFGITPVEAASFGCIPVVFAGGGPKDVVSELGCDTGFRTIDECVDIVESLLSDPLGSTALSEHLIGSAARFSAEQFRIRVVEAITSMGLDLPS